MEAVTGDLKKCKLLVIEQIGQKLESHRRWKNMCGVPG